MLSPAIPAQEAQMIDSGHRHIGKRIARPFGTRIALATITKWVAAGDAEDEPALFRAEHDDGDLEDLEENEVADAIAMYRRVLSFGRATAK